MRKRNNFVKFIFTLLLLVSIFAFSFSACSNVVEASTVESKPHDEDYEYIYFTPLYDVPIGEVGFTFQAFKSQARIDIHWDSLTDSEYVSYTIANVGDTLEVRSPIAYEAGSEYCIKIANENYFGISNVIRSYWTSIGITHCYFNYYRFTDTFDFVFLSGKCVEANFLECLIYDDFRCTNLTSSFFQGCDFKLLYLPFNLEFVSYDPIIACDSLTDIYFRSLPVFEGSVVYECYNLDNFWFKDSNDEYYSTQFLVNDTKLVSMVGGSIPSNIIDIGIGCFSSFDNDILIIPSNVSKIEEEAFESAYIGDLIFTSQMPPIVELDQSYREMNRIIVPYGSYDTYIIQDFFNEFSDIVFEAEKPLWSASLITSIISILMGGITSLSYGIGSGLTDLVSSIFISSNGGLSLFGGVIIVFAGLSLAIGLCRLIISFITSLGGDD